MRLSTNRQTMNAELQFGFDGLESGLRAFATGKAVSQDTDRGGRVRPVRLRDRGCGE